VIDLEAEGAPQRLIDALASGGFGEPDAIVHNLGGTLEVNDPFCPVADWRRVWRFNLEIAIELNRHYVPKMMQRKWGRVVHISSISSMENHGPIPYCSVKAALNAYTRSLGRYVAPHGVVISAVLPGAVWTEGGYWDDAMRERPEHVEKYLKDRMAIGRLGQPAEISGLVALLCSDHASFCVGSLFPVDGGQGRGYFGL
jgi:3-oxoacyl-[acyl-carrier protein] reductase